MKKLFLILPLQCLKLHHIQLKFHTQGDTLSQGEHCQQPRSTNKMLSVLKINNEITNKNKSKQKNKEKFIRFVMRGKNNTVKLNSTLSANSHVYK